MFVNTGLYTLDFAHVNKLLYYISGIQTNSHSYYGKSVSELPNVYAVCIALT